MLLSHPYQNMSSHSLVGDQWTFLLLLKQTQGHPVLYPLLSKQVIIHYFISDQNQILSLNRIHLRLWIVNIFQNNSEHSERSTVATIVYMFVLYPTLWHCSTKKLSVSYLKLCKAGVKHEMLVNDQPQGNDSMFNW